MTYIDAIVSRDNRAIPATVRRVVGGEGLLSTELLAYWRDWFRLPAQATQTAIYARLGLVADIAIGKEAR